MQLAHNPSWEEAKHHVFTWHQGASHGAAAWGRAACGGTQEEEMALLEELAAEGQHPALH